MFFFFFILLSRLFSVFIGRCFVVFYDFKSALQKLSASLFFCAGRRTGIEIDHMSCVSFYGEDQSEALKCHVVLSHATCWSLTRSVDLWPYGTKCTRNRLVSHVEWHNTSMGGIMPYHIAGKFEKRTVYERQYATCGIPKSVRMEMSLTSSNDSRHCMKKSLKFWSKNVFQKKRWGPPKTNPDQALGASVYCDQSPNVIFKFLTALPFYEQARLPTAETFLFRT